MDHSRGVVGPPHRRQGRGAFGWERQSDILRHGSVSERPKEHASKACVGASPPWVRIPPLPPATSENAGPPRSKWTGVSRVRRCCPSVPRPRRRPRPRPGQRPDGATTARSLRGGRGLNGPATPSEPASRAGARQDDRRITWWRAGGHLLGGMPPPRRRGSLHGGAIDTGPARKDTAAARHQGGRSSTGHLGVPKANGRVDADRYRCRRRTPAGPHRTPNTACAPAVSAPK